MGNTKGSPSEKQHVPAVKHVCEESGRLLAAFAQTSVLGFAILGRDLRYEAINPALAEINGLPAEAHLGHSIGEIFGEGCVKLAEPSYRQVLEHAQSSYFELRNALLPTRAGSRYWGLNINFPIKDRAGRVTQIGILVVEVTQQRRLEQFVVQLAGELDAGEMQQTSWLAKELHDSLEDYHADLAVTLDVLVGRKEENSELLARSVQALDQRVMSMDALISAVASRFPIDR